GSFYIFYSEMLQQGAMGDKRTGKKDAETGQEGCSGSFEEAGPNCLRGPCPEGKFKCENPPKASDFDA
ncbi:unnamed protein product, partial [marine sediment metagenome]